MDSCENLLKIIRNNSSMNIKRLEFFNNMSGDKGAKHIAELLSLLPHIEYFRWSSTRTNEEGAIALCHALARCPALRHLEIVDNYFGEDCGALLADAVRNMPHLSELMLVDLSLGDEGVLPLLEAVKECSIRLRVLKLGFNDLTEEAIAKLCELLPIEETLEVLGLEENSLGSRGACMLVKTLEDCCPRLTSLDLRRNQIGPKAAELVVKVCLRKKSMEYLDLDGNEISEEALGTIRKELEKCDKESLLGGLENNDCEYTSESIDEIKEFL